MILEENELNSISGGGALAWEILTGIGVVITLIAGIFDGYMRPLKCN